MTSALLEKTHDPKTHLIDARGVAKIFGLNYRELGRVISESENTVKAPRPSQKLQPKLQRLLLAYEALQTAFPDDAIPKWMRHPIRRLGGQTPLALLEQRGLDSFVALSEEIASGAYA